MKLYFDEVNKKYYEKFGEFLAVPYPDVPKDEIVQKMLSECMKCIEQNKKFDSQIFFEKNIGKLSKETLQ